MASHPYYIQFSIFLKKKIKKYTYMYQEAAVVTHPDAADLEKGRAAAAAAGAAASPKTGPDPSRAFAKDSNSRTSSSGLWGSHPAYTHIHTYTHSARAPSSEFVDHVAHAHTHTYV